ncbi:hypothetical protein RHGRI_032716 [Rhododendron griersonianum]|uniref:Uncharacterized protein n=1 Tax=Rhododendron griersonianum TaxID=479676 RepID=A0AAV6IHQ1_9ERIC|nr:hypothetical protein RHGRI_032716 [Rhododendron griersonianum]
MWSTDLLNVVSRLFVFKTHGLHSNSFQSSVTVLPLNGLGSSNGVGTVNNSGIWTSLHKPPLQLPWMPRTQNRHYRRHQCGGDARDFVLRPGTSPRKGGIYDMFLKPGTPAIIDDLVLRAGTPTTIDDLVLRAGTPMIINDLVLRAGTPTSKGGDAHDLFLRPEYSQRDVFGNDAHPSIKFFMGDETVRMWTCMAATYINGSLVRLAFHQDGNILTVLAGTIISSDGIIATSSSCLRFLKGEELKKVRVDVTNLDTEKIYKGVLLDADFCSNIAFVKITSHVDLASAVFGNLDHLLPCSSVVAASCTTKLGSLDLFRMMDHAKLADGLPNSKAEPNFVVGLFSRIAYEEENNEPHKARTSGQIIKAAARNSLDTAVGGCLVDPRQGVVGIIHRANPDNGQIEATPIDLVVKYLEHSEKAGYHTRFYVEGVSWIFKKGTV